MRVKIVKDGYPILITIAAAMVISFLFKWIFLAKVLCLILLFSLYFFRDPERFVPLMPEVIVSPADGRVLEVKKVKSEILDEECYKVSIFMSIFDVHINRLPFAGKVIEKNYNAGRFFNASLDKASEHNERMTYIIECADFKYTVTQIAGLIARRIISYVKERDLLKTGEKIGMIKFGSRAEIEFPVSKIDINISVGQQVYAGETIIGKLINGQDSGEQT
jgi:phosphatidylserine decarboxylase